MFKSGLHEKNESGEADTEYDAGSQSCLFINSSP